MSQQLQFDIHIQDTLPWVTQKHKEIPSFSQVSESKSSLKCVFNQTAHWVGSEEDRIQLLVSEIFQGNQVTLSEG